MVYLYHRDHPYHRHLMDRVLVRMSLDDEISLNDDISVYFEEIQSFVVLILVFE